MSTDIVVVGSLNMDMVVKVERRPTKGETILGSDFFMSPGGKGANQAYAVGNLGGSVAIIGRLGSDVFAESLHSNLRKVGVDISAIDINKNESSGIAIISIDGNGDNSIIVAPGANKRVSTGDIRRKESLIKNSKLLMIQLEIPLESVIEAIEIANYHHVPVLLDPAPARQLPDEILKMIDFITPNETEIYHLTGIEVTDNKSAKLAAVELLGKGIKTVFAKLGAKGVTVVNVNRSHHFPGYAVDVVDTTAAGDAFAGALGKALSEGKDVWAAAQFANAVGALAVTRYGAQQSIPNLMETEAFIKQMSVR
jgi:ribokinase